jgi:hypothetical protein
MTVIFLSFYFSAVRTKARQQSQEVISRTYIHLPAAESLLRYYALMYVINFPPQTNTIFIELLRLTFVVLTTVEQPYSLP